MRFNFDLLEPDTGAPTPSPSSTSKQEVEWLPLQSHPVFNNGSSTTQDSARGGFYAQMPKNLMAWDGATRLYFWDQNMQRLHRISIRLGEPDPTSVLAASPSKVLQADKPLNFVVDKVCINRSGSALVLASSEGISVMHLYGHTSMKEKVIICRTFSVASDIYSSGSSVIHVLQILWYPYSDTHLGVLSADSVFRLFDLSSDVEHPEQEYYLQPVEQGRLRNAMSICPIDFSFGADHLWDRFSVFVLFSDGSIYILCPVVPFGSVHKWESILEIYNDAHTFGMKSSNSKAVSNSSQAISWLESVFPELAHQAAEGGNLSALRAQHYASCDASLRLQGPLHRVIHGGEEDSEVEAAECEGHAVGFLYNSVCKDSILVTAWSSGKLQIDALADEIQPLWVVGISPNIFFDSYDKICGMAMVCESFSSDISSVKLGQPLDHNVWQGHSPPLFRLAIVDLALPRNTDKGSVISLFVDPLSRERMYCLHNGGLDSIILHFLPFTSQTSGWNENMRTPSVHSIINMCLAESSSSSPLLGFVALSDPCGLSWIVGLDCSHECIVLDMEIWNLLLPLTIDIKKSLASFDEERKSDSQTVISKELLGGPKSVVLPPSNVRSIAVDSIEGRSILHQYFKLFHENYVEYAHKVYFELKLHGPSLKKLIEDQHSRLRAVQQKLLKVGEKQEKMFDRIDSAVKIYDSLEERLKILRNRPGLQRKPLTKAERELKLELDKFAGGELDALHSAIEAVNARLQRFIHSRAHEISDQQGRALARRKNRDDDEISQLKSSVEKLLVINDENAKKVKIVEATLRNRENAIS